MKLTCSNIEWVARHFNILVLEYCTFESDVKYFFVLQVLLLNKNIDVRISRAREIPLRCAKIVNFGESCVPADQSHGPASDMQSNFALRVAFVSR